MKASDLRIGNYLLFVNKLQEVSSIHSDNTIRLRKTKNDNCHGCYSVDSIAINPIPLTEELLLTFGFEYHSFDKNYVIKNKDGYCNSIKKYDGEWCYNNDISDANCYFIRELKYIHQLQNLYYALNEEELTIK
jgi:hypothetical protein